MRLDLDQPLCSHDGCHSCVCHVDPDNGGTNDERESCKVKAISLDMEDICPPRDDGL